MTEELTKACKGCGLALSIKFNGNYCPHCLIRRKSERHGSKIPIPKDDASFDELVWKLGNR